MVNKQQKNNKKKNALWHLFCILSAGTLATTAIAPTSCHEKEEDKNCITVEETEKEMDEGKQDVTVKGNAGSFLSNIKLINNNVEFAIATDATIGDFGFVKIQFTLQGTKPTTTINDLVLTYYIDGVEGKPIEGFKYKASAIFTVEKPDVDIVKNSKDFSVTFKIKASLEGQKLSNVSLKQYDKQLSTLPEPIIVGTEYQSITFLLTNTTEKLQDCYIKAEVGEELAAKRIVDHLIIYPYLGEFSISDSYTVLIQNEISFQTIIASNYGSHTLKQIQLYDANDRLLGTCEDLKDVWSGGSDLKIILTEDPQTGLNNCYLKATIDNGISKTIVSGITVPPIAESKIFVTDDTFEKNDMKIAFKLDDTCWIKKGVVKFWLIDTSGSYEKIASEGTVSEVKKETPSEVPIEWDFGYVPAKGVSEYLLRYQVNDGDKQTYPTKITYLSSFFLLNLSSSSGGSITGETFATDKEVWGSILENDLNAATNPTAEPGYNFDGWYYDGQPLVPGSPLQAGMLLVANFVEKEILSPPKSEFRQETTWVSFPVTKYEAGFTGFTLTADKSWGKDFEINVTPDITLLDNTGKELKKLDGWSARIFNKAQTDTNVYGFSVYLKFVITDLEKQRLNVGESLKVILDFSIKKDKTEVFSKKIGETPDDKLTVQIIDSPKLYDAAERGYVCLPKQLKNKPWSFHGPTDFLLVNLYNTLDYLPFAVYYPLADEFDFETVPDYDRNTPITIELLSKNYITKTYLVTDYYWIND